MGIDAAMIVTEHSTVDHMKIPARVTMRGSAVTYVTQFEVLTSTVVATQAEH